MIFTAVAEGIELSECGNYFIVELYDTIDDNSATFLVSQFLQNLKEITGLEFTPLEMIELADMEIITSVAKAIFLSEENTLFNIYFNSFN